MKRVMQTELTDFLDQYAPGDWAVNMAREFGNWPLPNVVLGVSVEDQATADDRIPWLLRTPAAKRIVSYEPALGQVDFGRWVFPQSVIDGYDEVVRRFSPMAPPPASLGRPQRLDGVIAGCETGRQRRPASSALFLSVRDQCVAAGVPFFLKAMEDYDGRIERMPWLEEFRGDGVMRGRRWDQLAWGTATNG
jgi:protein gp37